MKPSVSSVTAPAKLTRILPFMAVLCATVLLVSQGLAWLGIDRAATAADRGEARVLLDAVAAQLKGLGRRPSRSELNGVLKRHRGAGLLYIELRDPFGAVAVGEGLLTAVQAVHGLRRQEERVRAQLNLPPPPHHPGMPRPPAGRPKQGEQPPTPLLIIELHTHVGPALRVNGRRALGVALVSALLFLVLAGAMRRVERQRARALRKAEHERRLAALGEMSAVVAHELRNPLTALKGHAQLLQEALASETPAFRKAQRVVEEAERLEYLSHSLLQFVRSGELAPEPTDMREVLAGVVASVGADQVAVQLGATPAMAAVDAARLHQALTNLVTNALQASAGQAEQETAEAQTPGAALVTVELSILESPPPGQVRVVVRDRGPGLDESVLARVFEPFFTTRARGTGLGLSIARRIVEAHQGQILARNQPTGGAEFEVVLPRLP